MQRFPVTFETNGTQPLKETFQVPWWVDLTWSVSPKVASSGHTEEEALFPEVIEQYVDFSADLYLKFVVQSEADFTTVDRYVKLYTERIGRQLKVYIMPEGGTPSEYMKHSTLDLVAEAVKRGYNITPRLQVLVGANLTGW